MKKIFMIAACIVSVQAFAQRNLDANRQADSLKASRIKKESAVTGNLMQFDGIKWGPLAHTFVSKNIYTGDDNLTGVRVLKGAAEAYPLYFDSLQYFSVNTNLGVRLNSRGALGTTITHANDIRFTTTATQTMMLHPSRLVLGVEAGGDIVIAPGATGAHSVILKGGALTASQTLVMQNKSDTMALLANIPHVAAGTNMGITGTGTWADPFVFNAAGGGGGGGTMTSLGLSSSDITIGGSASPVTVSGAYTLTLPNINSNVGTFNNVTVNAKGQVTGASNVTYGSVSNFSAGNLSPLFNTSVATSTSTPALSFSLSNAAANTWFGNATAGSTTPSYNAAGALTKTDDANVTLTLGGTPASAMLKAVSLTVGWTGTLSVSRGGTGAGTLTGVLIGNGTSAFTGLSLGAGQSIRRNAGNTAYEAFTPGSGTVTVVDGTANRIEVVANTTTPVINIAPTYVGQTSITTLGTIINATWNATPIATTYGGVPTGGTTGQYLTKASNSNYSLIWASPTSTLQWTNANNVGHNLPNYITPDPATVGTNSGIHTGGGYSSSSVIITGSSFNIGSYDAAETFILFDPNNVAVTLPNPSSHTDRVIEIVHQGSGGTISIATTYTAGTFLNTVVDFGLSDSTKPYSIKMKSVYTGSVWRWFMVSCSHNN